MTKFYLGILETGRYLYWCVVRLVSMYVVSDFWRAPSSHSASYLYFVGFPVGAPSKGLLFACHLPRKLP